MDDLLADFVAETREMLEAIGGELVAWEADPADRARLDSIFRFVHTVKGNCGFFDFPRLEKLSHAAEGALAEVRAGRRQPGAHLVNGVLAIIDRIAEIVDAIEAGKTLPENGDERLIAALEPEVEDDGGEQACAVGSATERKAAGGNGTARSIRLPVDLLDRLMSGVSDMVLARNDLARRLRDAGNQPTIDGPFERLSAILDDVREGVTRMRMQRIEHLYNALPRLVRDLCAELGKQVMIDLEGGDVELDREMIETVRDPLTHIIRNAIDHGIETPSERLARGKREIGMLSISARQAGNRIALVIRDDGSGFDIDRIAAKAVAHGIATQAEVDAMSRQRKLELVFEPGLSTADKVNEISGRGVGMDVVRANLERVGGTIEIDSEPGEGTMLTLQLPLTLSIIAALTVSCNGCRFAIPRSYIEEIARGSSSAIALEMLGDASFAVFREARIPCIRLATVLGLEDSRPLDQSTFVFVRLARGDLYALAVDRVLDNEDLVVKPLAPAIMATGVYSGSTLLDDGNPILMLDMPNIAQAHALAAPGRAGKASVELAAGGQAEAEGVLAILFSDLSGRRRAIRMAQVRRIQSLAPEAINREGSAVQATLDGAILPLAGLVGDAVPHDRLTVLRLGDGSSELLLAVGEIENTAALAGPIVPVPGDDTLEGSVLIEDEPAGVIDAHALFARHAGHLAPQRRLRCRVPADDEWARSFLAPLVEAAGYAVVTGEDAEADLAFHVSGERPEPVAAVPVIRLRADARADGADAQTIYRYDRDALLAALKTAAGGA
jgi:two-component system, chemotaxis family, sensor kinase CheA